MANKILFVQPKLSGIGGIEKVVPLVAEVFSRRGYMVSSATFYGVRPEHDFWGDIYHLFGDFEKVGIFGKLSRIYKRFTWLSEVYKSNKPQVIVVSASGTIIILMLLKFLRIIKVPVIVYEHQSLFLNDTGYATLRKIFYKYADGFVGVSSGVVEELKNNFPGTPVILAYNPVKKCEVIKQKTVDPIFITASRLEYVKGVDILVEIFIRYVQSGGRGNLIIFGEGSIEEILKDKVRKAGLTERIIFSGVTDNLCQELSSATAYLSCAKQESLGVSLIEALSAGLPIVCIDAPYGPREVMNIEADVDLEYPYESDVGILIDVLNKSPKNISPKFNKALNIILSGKTDYHNRAKLRAAFFSPEKTVDQIESLFKKIL
ncbi:MAG: glycosyltransferase [Candidatus Nomurabacteria bacterium]|nr:glycosyltransferase [Candidatus Nomurabacteria bacterium]USN88134.1 MAG: glycosyltransferase [Candidatus Nomurabacteria bacterium]